MGWVKNSGTSARLQCRAVEVDESNDIYEDTDGKVWKKCTFTAEITHFSKRTPSLAVPAAINGKKVKLVRWCSEEWHYRVPVQRTLTRDETEAVLKDRPTTTIIW